jgi:hypothetical protein
MNLKGNSRENLHESQGGILPSSPLRSDGSWDSQVGRLDHVSGGQRQLKWAIRLESTQFTSWFCDGQTGRLDCMSDGQETLKTKLTPKVDCQTQVHSGQMILMVVRQGGCTI